MSSNSHKNKNRLLLLKNLKQDTYCRIGQSKIHGIGILAIRNVPKGVNPFRLTDSECINHRLVKLSANDVAGLPIGAKKLIHDFIAKDTDDGSYFVPYLGMNSLDISFYMNHSEDNNVDIVSADCDFLEFRTNRLIKKGEELTINYVGYEF